MARRIKKDPRAGRNYRRSSYTRDVKQSFLIICEGENTEPDYFNAFRLTSANVKTVGGGDNTVHLVQKAINIRNDERSKGRIYNQCWVVFDKDEFPNEDFNAAIELAKSNGMHVAYSNQAFELWFLLHFSLIEGPMHRNLYAKKLSNALGFPYDKKSGTGAIVYRELSTKQQQAIRNAKASLEKKGDMSPALAESSTTVHQLVEELNKYKD